MLLVFNMHLLCVFTFSLLVYYGVVEGEACYRPEVPMNAAILPDNDLYASGDQVSYVCTYGYILVEGDEVRECRNGTWTNTAPLCLDIDSLCAGAHLTNNKCLYLKQKRVNWTDSVSSCGPTSQLFSVQDGRDATVAAGLLHKFSVKKAWTTSHAISAWQWTDGSLVTEFLWGGGEPNHLKGVENNIQLRMNLGYFWNDARGSDVFEDNPSGSTINKFVCQYEGPCNGGGYDGNPHIQLDGSCFVFKSLIGHDIHDGDCVSGTQNLADRSYCQERGVSWHDSKKACNLTSGQLAQPKSKEVSEALTAYIANVSNANKNFGGNYWIGGEFTKPADSRTTGSYPLSGSTCGAITQKGEITSTECNFALPTLCTKAVTARKCGAPPQAPHTDPVYPVEYNAGERVTQQCKFGYEAVDAKPCQCLDIGRWDVNCDSSISCTEITTTTTTTPTTPTTTTSTTATTAQTTQPSLSATAALLASTLAFNTTANSTVAAPNPTTTASAAAATPSAAAATTSAAAATLSAAAATTSVAAATTSAAATVGFSTGDASGVIG